MVLFPTALSAGMRLPLDSPSATWSEVQGRRVPSCERRWNLYVGGNYRCRVRGLEVVDCGIGEDLSLARLELAFF